MKKFMNFLKKHSKKLAVVGVVSVAALGVSSATSWGPDRKTFTIEKPADYITFNSITNNPHVGDERNFVVVKDAANQNSGGWQDNITVQPGKEYLVRIYVHNNAADNLNLVAQNTRVKASVPTTTGKSVPLSGFVSADNARPTEVWDDVNFNSTRDFNLAYVAGSARVYNNGYAAGGNGVAMPDSIVTSAGAPVGYEKADGKVPGCFKYVSYVTFKVKPQFAAQPDYSIEKEGRVKGTKDWSKNFKAKAGDEVEWRMQFKNTGETRLNQVSIVDETPKNTTTVQNSVELWNNNNPSGYKFPNTAIQGKLINAGIGDYSAKSNAWIYYNSKIDSKDKLECGTNKLINKVYATPKGMTTIKDEATVEVDKECEQPQPKFACEALDVDKASLKIGETANFTARGSASGGATITGYIFRVNGQTVQDSSSNTFAYKAEQNGEFTVSVIVKTDKGNTSESEKCKKVIKVTKEEAKPEYECTALTATDLGNKKYRFKVETRVRGNNVTVNKYVFNFGDNTEEVNTTNATVEHTYAKAGNYTASVRVIFNVGDEQKDANCVVSIKIPAEEKPPVTPPANPELPLTEIPNTGMASVVAGIFGTSATAYGAYAWIESRRALRNNR